MAPTVPETDTLLPADAEELSPSELLDFWRNLTSKPQRKLLQGLSPEQSGILIEQMTETERTKALTQYLSPVRRAQILNGLAPDKCVDILQSVPDKLRQELLGQLNREQQDETEFLLNFAENCAAGIMTTRYNSLRTRMKIHEALHQIRQAKQAHNLEIFYYFYVLDGQNHLAGVISLKKILLSAPQDYIDDLMNRDVISVESQTPQEKVVSILEEHDFLAVPVLNEQKQMLGVVTFDDVIDLIRREQAHNITNLGGISSPNEREHLLDHFLQAPLSFLLLKRLPWIILLMFAGTLTTNLLEYFKTLMEDLPLLVIFIPLIIQTGGNVGSQSAVLLIRSISARNVAFKDAGQVLLKELCVGAGLSAIAALLIFFRNTLFLPALGWQENLALSVSLAFVILLAALIGVFTPLFLSRIGIDPTVTSGPLMATIMDIVGLGIYFLSAGTLLQYWLPRAG